jgi:hypothetical protein
MCIVLYHFFNHVSIYLKGIVTCLATEDSVGLLTGLFNNLPIVTTINYYTVTGLHTLQTLLTII